MLLPIDNPHEGNVFVLTNKFFNRTILFISKFQFDLVAKCLHKSPWLGRLGDYSLTMTLNLIYYLLFYYSVVHEVCSCCIRVGL